MSETLLISILGILSTIILSLISYFLGRRAERQRQSLIIRVEMLKPIEEWLQGAERMTGIIRDTLSSVVLNSPTPVTYNLEERRKTAQFMSEKTSAVFGILSSRSLQTGKTERLTVQLGATIDEINGLIRDRLLPLDIEILDNARAGLPSTEFMVETSSLTSKLDKLFKIAYSLIAQIKTALI